MNKEYDINGTEIKEGDILEARVKNPCQWKVVIRNDRLELDRYIDGKKEYEGFGMRNDLIIKSI